MTANQVEEFQMQQKQAPRARTAKTRTHKPAASIYTHTEKLLPQPEPVASQMIDSLPAEQREVVERVFSFYCSYGEPMNCTSLKSSKFVKLLKDAGLIKSGVL